MSKTVTHLALLIACGLILLPSLNHAEETGTSTTVPSLDFENYIIWDQQDLTKAAFVPEAQLAQYRNDESLEALLNRPEAPFVTPSEFEAVRARAFQDPKNHCSWSSSSSTSPYTDASDVDLATWLAEREAAVIATGRVLKVVTGWGRTGVTTLVYVQLADILSCNKANGRQVWSNDIVSIALRRGAILVDGRFFCNATDLALTVPAPGDQVLVTGHPAQGYEHYLGTGMLHLIHDGFVEPQPIAGVSPRKPVPLNQIIKRLTDRSKECGLQ